MTRLFFLSLALLLPLPLLRAQEQKPADLPVITLHIDNANLRTEVAATESERETGLMYRTKMDDNDGMIFLMPVITSAHFWMKNTYIPLSIAFLDKNGVILEIHDMQPEDTTTLSSDSNQVAYALEVNQHWFALNKIKPGDQVDPSPLSWSKLMPQ